MAKRLFSAIPNTNVVAPCYPIHPLPAEKIHSLILIKSVKEMKTLSLLFPCADDVEHYKTHVFIALNQPFQYISHLIGHEGPGSVLSALKSDGDKFSYKDLANSLSAGLAQTGAKGFDFFKIAVELTEKGIEEYESVINYIFQYINLMKRSGAVKWMYEEVI
jgi:insulysin